MEMLVLEIGEHQSMDLIDSMFIVCKGSYLSRFLKKCLFLIFLNLCYISDVELIKHLFTLEKS